MDRYKDRKHFEEIIAGLKEQINIHQQEEAEVKEYLKQRDGMIEQIAQLKADHEAERKQRIFEVSEKEREKLMATDRLRKEMLKQIKQTKASLLSLNDQQLETTTRLTMLQNTQLTIELEYQSKQTE